MIAPPCDGADTAEEQPWKLPRSTEVQGIVFDADGSLRPSLLAYPDVETSSTAASALKVWRNNGTGFEL
jgi:integrin alpha FG-GAP repeat containing protein 1